MSVLLKRPVSVHGSTHAVWTIPSNICGSNEIVACNCTQTSNLLCSFPMLYALAHRHFRGTYLYWLLKKGIGAFPIMLPCGHLIMYYVWDESALALFCWLWSPSSSHHCVLFAYQPFPPPPHLIVYHIISDTWDVENQTGQLCSLHKTAGTHLKLTICNNSSPELQQNQTHNKGLQPSSATAEVHSQSAQEQKEALQNNNNTYNTCWEAYFSSEGLYYLHYLLWWSLWLLTWMEFH